MDLHKNYLQIAVMNDKGKVLENTRITTILNRWADSSMKILRMKRFA
jgi:hypothetical protein